LRFLHVINRYWPARGGSETHLGELSTRLAADGHSVTVVTTDALDFRVFWDPHQRRVSTLGEEHNGVRILRFPVRHIPGAPLSYVTCRHVLRLLSRLSPVPTSALTRLSRLTPWVPDLLRWLDTTDERFDLVAGMNILFEPLLQAGLCFARRRGLPFVVYPLTHLGAGARPGDDDVGAFYTMRHQLAVVRASDAAAVQTATERAFYAGHGIDPERLPIIGPGVDPSAVLGGRAQRFRDAHGLVGPIVVGLSAMGYNKGTVELVQAARALWRAGYELHLVLAGEIVHPFPLFLASLPPDDRQRIQVLGPVTDDEKRDLLAAADVVALPSRTDSFGIVYLEAWLYRKPVIGARAWGISDVIADGEDGLLVPFGDVSALAAAIAFLLEHPDRRAALGENGWQKVHRFHTWDQKYALVRELYLRLIDERRACTC